LSGPSSMPSPPQRERKGGYRQSQSFSFSKGTYTICQCPWRKCHASDRRGVSDSFLERPHCGAVREASCILPGQLSRLRVDARPFWDAEADISAKRFSPLRYDPKGPQSRLYRQVSRRLRVANLEGGTH